MRYFTGIFYNIVLLVRLSYLLKCNTYNIYNTYIGVLCSVMQNLLVWLQVPGRCRQLLVLVRNKIIYHFWKGRATARENTIRLLSPEVNDHQTSKTWSLLARDQLQVKPHVGFYLPDSIVLMYSYLNSTRKRRLNSITKLWFVVWMTEQTHQHHQ